MSLAQAIMKAKKLTHTNTKKKNTQPKEFNYSILNTGGESILSFVDKSGKKREVQISVHSPNNHFAPEYKYHYRNALGCRVFIKCNKESLAQEVCNHLEESKGKYTVSGFAV